MKRILVAGIGNIFFGDDAFGVEVARELLRQSLPPEVKVVDFGIRSYDLAYALTEGYDAAILVDATPRGEAPGTVYLIEPAVAGLAADVDGHGMGAACALKLARSFGNCPARLYLVGCEPGELDTENGRMGLSEPVLGAVPRASGMIRDLAQKLLEQGTETKIEAGLAPV